MTAIRSAEIIAFPPRGRYAGAGRHDDASNLRASVSVASAVSGSAWYHEEAIRDERAKSN